MFEAMLLSGACMRLNPIPVYQETGNDAGKRDYQVDSLDLNIEDKGNFSQLELSELVLNTGLAIDNEGKLVNVGSYRCNLHKELIMGLRSNLCAILLEPKHIT